MQINDPRKIPREDLPLIVLTDCTSGLMEFLIKFRTRGNYNHIMWAHIPGKFATQGNIYAEVAMEKYIKRNARMKFVEVVGLSFVQKKLILASIKKKLSLPWYKKLYDWVAIAGQAIGIKKISFPGLDICSEDVPQHLLSILDYVDDDLANVLGMVPVHGSPEDLNTFFKQFPQYFRTYGKWESDDVGRGIVFPFIGILALS